jgi:hypothetical protein
VRALAWIAEQRIREAMDRGVFDDLPLRGEPVRLDDYEGLPEEVRMVLALLHEAGLTRPIR